MKNHSFINNSARMRCKKFISFILTLTLVFSVFSIMPLSASAAVGDVFTIDGLTYTVTDEVYGSYTVGVTGFDNSTTDVVIPEKVANNGVEYSVTSISDSTFQGNTDILSLSIPGTVKTTTPNCFMNCSSLQNITLNEGIEDIVGATFYGTAVKEIRFPKSLTTIRKFAFYGCPNLKNAYFYSDVNILSSVFYNSTSIESIYCYGKNTTFNSTAFKNINSTFVLHGYAGSTAETFANTKGYNFAEIKEEEPTTSTEPTEVTEPSTEVTEPSTEVTEPSSVTEPTTATDPTESTEETKAPEIGDIITIGAFTYTITGQTYGSYTVSVTGFDNSTVNVVIPETVNIGGTEYTVSAIPKSSDTFYENANIEYVSIPGTVKSIDKLAFYKCTSLKEVTLNEGIEIINMSSFGYCAFESITFPKSLKTLNTMAVRNCTALKDIYINSDVEIKSGAFGTTTNIENIYCYSSNINFNTDAFKATNTTFTIHGYAGSTAQTFANTNGYNFAEIKEEPTTSPTTEPTTEPDTSIFTWKKINNDTAVEITGIKDEYKMQATVDIPSEINGLPVTVIGVSAFEGGQVMYLTIPSSVFVISDGAFKNCSGLTTITFAENSQLQKIGNEAFYRTNGADDRLNSVELPESLKLIGYRAFYNRANLLTVKVYSKDVYFGDAAKGKEVFDLYTGTSNLKLYGYTGSTAETYAAENGHSFRYLDLNTDELQALYNKAEAIDSSLYTEESYANLATAMKAAKRMLANKDATPAQVEQCIADLQTAIDNLEVYVEPTTTEPATTPTEPVTEILLGDVDLNGNINIFDATYIQLHIAELSKITENGLIAADVNQDKIVSVADATILQNWLAENDIAMGYHIGEFVKKEDTPTEPTDPEPSTVQFYLPNYVSWLTDMGGKMWVYNDATAEFMVMDYDEESNCFYTDLPAEWMELSFYRTPFETTEEDFDINNPWSDETQSGVILNKWEHLGSRGDYNCYKITGDGEGLYTTYDPNVEPEDERTIYFDNSKTKWSNVYIYGWSFGISNEFIQMEPEGNDIWSYTFYDDLPIDGVKGFLFVNSTSWSGATQTVDLATEEGKNLFVPTPGGNKLSGKWEIYTP